MTKILLPAVWLIVFLVGLPQLTETVYTPSLPDIANALHTSESMMEYTLTIYLLGFAIGTFFWGKISDHLGRKPCIIAGLIIFIIGCVGCYGSSKISILMINRFIQAFGGSIGSVLGQAICRDAFHGPALGKVYSSIGASLALFPALGPLVGGMIAENFGWPNIFLFLICIACILLVLVIFKLPETYDKTNCKPTSILDIGLKLLQDKYVLSLGIIVAGSNGILFSYFAEGPFYMIQALGLTPSKYGISFIFIALATMMGGIFSRKLHTKYESKRIMEYGLNIIVIMSIIFSFIVIAHTTIYKFSSNSIIVLSIICQMGITFGICIAASNALAIALLDYKYAIGTASSLFGCFYYILISFFTFIEGYLHNGTIFVMPLYFLALSIMMKIVQKTMLKA